VLASDTFAAGESLMSLRTAAIEEAEEQAQRAATDVPDVYSTSAVGSVFTAQP